MKSLLPLLITILTISLAPLSAQIHYDLKSEWVYGPSQKTYFKRSYQRNTPVLASGKVYYGALSGHVYAVNQKKGFKAWSYKTKAPVDGALTYGRSKIFVGDIEGNLYALHADTGRLLWSGKRKTAWLSPFVQSGKRLFAVSENNQIFAFAEKTGKLLWRHGITKTSQKMTLRGTCEPVVEGNSLYVGFQNGLMMALNKTNGNIIWKKHLQRNQGQFFDIDRKPLIQGDSLIINASDSGVFRVNKSTGRVIWPSLYRATSNPLIFNGHVIVATSDNFLMALNYRNGNQVWSIAIPIKGVGHQIQQIKGSKFLLSSTQGDVLVFDGNNGRIYSHLSLAKGTESQWIVRDHHIYATTHAGYLWKLLLKKNYRSHMTEELVTPGNFIHGRTRQNTMRLAIFSTQR